MLIHRSTHGQVRFATLIAAALLMRALVPAGWMPALENGMVTLRLCGGWRPATVEQPVVEAHHGGSADHITSTSSAHHGHQDGEQKGSDPPCSFAAAGLAWTASNTSAVAKPPEQRDALVGLVPPAVAVGRGLAAPPPPSTGPPLLS